MRFFYLIRKNIAVVLPYLMDSLALSKTQMGIILSLFSATYAVAKLVNGPLCDRSNPRFFMALGLTGAMSYFGAVITSTFSGWITDQMGWGTTFGFWVACAVLSIFILIPLLRQKQINNNV